MGRQRELLVGQAMAYLQEWGCIRSYVLSRPGDEMDRAGVDALLVTLQGKVIRFQIKGSERGMKKHLRKHPDIPCVNLHGYTFSLDIAGFLQKQFELSPRSL